MITLAASSNNIRHLKNNNNNNKIKISSNFLIKANFMNIYAFVERGGAKEEVSLSVECEPIMTLCVPTMPLKPSYVHMP